MARCDLRCSRGLEYRDGGGYGVICGIDVEELDGLADNRLRGRIATVIGEVTRYGFG